jgi:signal peptidase I
MKELKNDKKNTRHSWFTSFMKGVLFIVVTILIAIVLRVFFIEIYKIPSASMEPALLAGDFILVSKMSYGARLLKPVKFFKQKKIEYVRTKGWGQIKKGDEFVFNFPYYLSSSDSTSEIWGGCIVKRCYGLPGDTVIIKNEGIKNERIKNEGIIHERINVEESWNRGFVDTLQKYNVFPYDSNLKWSIDNYGPLYVPAKGQAMKLTKTNVYWYKGILKYETPNSSIEDSSLIINGKQVLQYTFQHNYYFMLGDNFYNSNDSRYWGFVPYDNVIGKVAMVLFSIDPNEYGLKKFRWSRLLKII